MRLIAGLFSLMILGFFCAVLAVAGLFFWFSRDLPSTQQLASYEPATLSRVYSGTGDILGEFHRERRLFTPSDEIPELIKHAFVSAEDKNFYTHEGVDWLALGKAMVDNVIRASAGRNLRGASGITQQVVKNFLLSGEKKVERKIREAILAMRLDKAVGKERILELYLNEIFLGARSYGVTAAAENYFGKRLEDIEPHEAAFIAALPKAPSDIHPVHKPEKALDRRNYVLKEMRENGYLDEQQYQTALAQPLVTLLNQPDAARERKQQRLDYFAEEIRRNLIDEMGEDAVYGGGLAIRSTVDPALQDVARETLQARLFEYSTTRGYVGPVARIEDLAPENEADWRQKLADLSLPRDLEPWHRAVVLLVGERSVQIGIEGIESGEPIYLPFSDVKDWAVDRKGYNAKGYPILGEKPKTPADLFALGDVIFVEQIENEDGSKRWSMRQIPQINGAVVAMDPNTGRVLAMQGGFSYQSSVFNRATQAKRQPGSSFKPFVYAAALEHKTFPGLYWDPERCVYTDQVTGEVVTELDPSKAQSAYLPNTIVLDAPVVLPQVSGDDWKPKNYSGKFYGPRPLRYGIEYSQNLMTVRLAMDFGMCKVSQYAQQFGVYDEMPPHLSYALGAGETTLMQMVSSYAMFANGGKRIEPTLIDRIQDRHGKTIYRHDDRICLACEQDKWRGQAEPYVPDDGEQVMDPATAYEIVSMLNGVTVRGTASRLGKALDFPVAGKTGTTNEARDAWFLGFSADVVVGCFIGYDNPRPMGRGGTGGSMCAPVFEKVIKAAQGDRPAREFKKPSNVFLQKINRQNGECVDQSRQGGDFIMEAFREGDEPCRGGRTIGEALAFGGDSLPLSSEPTGNEATGDDGSLDPGAPRPPRPPRPTGSLTPGGVY
ncbi:MAG: transglycosylase domain-containing protein [Neomegalonema sp.]|nr:transglycosylase domain-containing protein [Neomegalonema sp.]